MVVVEYIRRRVMSCFLRGQKVELRKLSIETPLDDYAQFINDVENLKWIDGVGNFPLSKEELLEYIRSNKGLLLGIFDLQGHHVGNIQLSAINHHHRHALYGIVIAQKYQGKGYGREASHLILKHAFEVLNLHRVYLMVVATNNAAVSFYENLGFEQEGIAKDFHLLNFEYHDCIRFYMLEDRYRELVQKGQFR